MADRPNISPRLSLGRKHGSLSMARHPPIAHLLVKPCFPSVHFIFLTNSTVEKEAWLSPKLVAGWREIVAVIILTLGHAIFASTRIAFDRRHRFYSEPSTNDSYIYNIAFESAILCLMVSFLHWRGWTPTDFKIKPNGKALFQGILLWIVVEAWKIVYWFLMIVLLYCAYHFAHLDLRPKSNLIHATSDFNYCNRLLFVGLLIINAFLEELICIGYAFNQIAAKKGPLFALLITTLLRITYHTWQGPLEISGTFIFFLFFGLFYWKYRNLCPLIVAHSVFDIWFINPVTMLVFIFSILGVK